MDKVKYFKFLDEAKSNPDCGGVIALKKRCSGLDVASKEYVARILKIGEEVIIAAKDNNEDEQYIANYLNILKERHQVECNCEKIFQSIFHTIPRWSEPKFLGWKLKLNQQSTTP